MGTIRGYLGFLYGDHKGILSQSVPKLHTDMEQSQGPSRSWKLWDAAQQARRFRVEG